MTRTYEGLAGEINTVLELCQQIDRYLMHWAAAGVRLEGRKVGLKKDALVQLVSEVEAMRDNLPQQVAT